MKIRLRNRLIFLTTFILFAGAAKTQEYTYRNFNTAQGLPSSEVYHAILDSKGYIWFATDNGVSRYDGYQFVNFDISKGLVNNTIFDIYEDWKGRIWFIALSGRLCYYQNNEITKYQHNQLIVDNTKSRSIPVKQGFLVDSLNNVFLSIASQGILKITEQGEVLNLLDESTNALITDIGKSKNLLLGYHNKSENKYNISINGKTKPFKPRNRFRKSSLFFANRGTNAENILFSINNTVYSYQNDSIVSLETFPSDIIWFSKDKIGNYWLSIRDNGIKSFNNSNFGSLDFSWFLKDKEVSSVLIDNEEGHWFTTLNNGVYYLPSKEIKSVKIATKKKKNVYSVAVSKKNVFFLLRKNK